MSVQVKDLVVDGFVVVVGATVVVVDEELVVVVVVVVVVLVVVVVVDPTAYVMSVFSLKLYPGPVYAPAAVAVDAWIVQGTVAGGTAMHCAWFAPMPVCFSFKLTLCSPDGTAPAERSPIS
jgi:hypothetical protein